MKRFSILAATLALAACQPESEVTVSPTSENSSSPPTTPTNTLTAVAPTVGRDLITLSAPAITNCSGINAQNLAEDSFGRYVQVPNDQCVSQPVERQIKPLTFDVVEDLTDANITIDRAYLANSANSYAALVIEFTNSSSESAACFTNADYQIKSSVGSVLDDDYAYISIGNHKGYDHEYCVAPLEKGVIFNWIFVSDEDALLADATTIEVSLDSSFSSNELSVATGYSLASVVANNEGSKIHFKLDNQQYLLDSYAEYVVRDPSGYFVVGGYLETESGALTQFSTENVWYSLGSSGLAGINPGDQVFLAPSLKLYYQESAMSAQQVNAKAVADQHKYEQAEQLKYFGLK